MKKLHKVSYTRNVSDNSLQETYIAYTKLKVGDNSSFTDKIRQVFSLIHWGSYDSLKGCEECCYGLWYGYRDIEQEDLDLLKEIFIEFGELKEIEEFL
jgi:hypothetical protein